MKKALLIGLLLGGMAAWAAGGGTAAEETSPASRPVPGDAGFFYGASSFALMDLSHIRMSVCTVDRTDMPKAVGTLNAYVLDERTARIERNKLLDLDLTQQVAPTFGQCIVFPDQRVGLPEGRLIYAASGLQLNDAGTLTTQSDGGLDGGAFLILYRGWRTVR